MFRKSLCFLLLALVLTVPASASGRYVAGQGDTLSAIAVRSHVCLHEVCAYNPQYKAFGALQTGAIVAVPVNRTELRSMEKEVVRLINAERDARGLSPLRSVPRIARISRKKAVDLRDNNYFDHTSPTYGTPFEMLRHFSVTYHYAGENIAKGYDTPEQVVQAWMASKGHRQNILNPNYTKIGVGCIDGISGPYWVQLFIG